MDGLTKELQERFWNKLREIFIDFVTEAIEKGILSTSQRWAIVKLIEKKIEIKNYTKLKNRQRS